jgi:hypothetical protein
MADTPSGPKKTKMYKEAPKNNKNVSFVKPLRFAMAPVSPTNALFAIGKNSY